MFQPNPIQRTADAKREGYSFFDETH